MVSTVRRRVGIVVTLLLLAGATAAGLGIWDHYLTGPWTRDGQVQAYVVTLAPEVSGRVAKLHVSDNQEVRRGDVLYEIEPVDFQIAVAAAEANVQSKQADMDAKRLQAARRRALTTLTTSEEEKQSFQASSDMARAAFA